MQYDYYYNTANGNKWRNNLIYTSLISKDKKTFVQWYHNDTDYHRGQNRVVDPKKMREKWDREIMYLHMMGTYYPDLVPEYDIDLIDKKIYLKIDGVDFWQRSLDRNNCNFKEVLPDWQEQMLEIIKAHNDLGFYKYSMHPSSYFVVGGKLKSINYFFSYSKDEEPFAISEVESHISDERQTDLKYKIEQLGLSWDSPTPLNKLQYLCWESFKTNYPNDFIEKAKACIL